MSQKPELRTTIRIQMAWLSDLINIRKYAERIYGRQSPCRTNNNRTMMVYCSTEHETIGMSPNLLMLGHEASTPLDIIYSMPTSIKAIPSILWEWELRERLEDAHTLVRKKLRGGTLRRKTYHDRRTSWEKL